MVAQFRPDPQDRQGVYLKSIGERSGLYLGQSLSDSSTDYYSYYACDDSGRESEAGFYSLNFILQVRDMIDYKFH